MMLRFFGRLQDAAGAHERVISLPSGVRDTEALRKWLTEEIPGLDDPSVRIAINDELVARTAPVAETDDVAFLPPVSGG